MDELHVKRSDGKRSVWDGVAPRIDTPPQKRGSSYQWALLTALSVQTPLWDRLRCVWNISVAEILASGPTIIPVAVMIRFSLSLDVYVCEHPVISNNVTL